MFVLFHPHVQTYRYTVLRAGEWIATCILTVLTYLVGRHAMARPVHQLTCCCRYGYVAISFMIIVLVASRILIMALGGGLGARRIYERLLTGIVYSPMVFFETTPLGTYVRTYAEY